MNSARPFRLLAATAATCTLLGCAAAPTVPAVDAPQAAAGSAPAAPAPEAAAAGEAAPAAQTAATNPFPGTSMRRTRSGEIVYCLRERPLGSNMIREVCENEDAMRARQAAQKQSLENVQRPRPGVGCDPVTGAC